MQNEDLILKYSLMASEEREFVLETLKKVKPKKILTIGIAAGANEALILDFLEKNNMLDSTQFFSIDYSKEYCYGEGRDSGFLVGECVPHLQKYWHYYTPGVSANYMEEIGGDIDFCIIDTVHKAPGEALDFLMVLPFLSKNATLIMHDLTFHVLGSSYNANTEVFDNCGRYDFWNICSILFNAWNGKKSYPAPYHFNKSAMFQNIGACVLSDNQLEDSNLESYFRVLNLPWYYMPTKADITATKVLFAKYYGKKYMEYFEKILSYQEHVITKNNERMDIDSIKDSMNKTLEKEKSRLGYKIDRAIANSYKRFYNKLRTR